MKDKQWHGMTYLLSFADASLDLFLMPLLPDPEQLKKRDHYRPLQETKKKEGDPIEEDHVDIEQESDSFCFTVYFAMSDGFLAAVTLSLADPLKSVL